MKRIKFPDIPFLMLLLLLGLIGLYVHLWMGDQFTLINREISDRDSALRQLLAQQIRISLHGTGYFVSRVNKMSPQDMEELLHSVRRAEVDGLIALSSIGGNRSEEHTSELQ